MAIRTRPAAPAREHLPSDQEAQGESTLARYLQGGKATKPDELGEGQPFQWRILTGEQQQLCVSRAVARFAELKVPEGLRFGGDYERECEWQILWEAMRDPEDADAPLARDVAELRRLLSDDERVMLYQRYCDFEDEAQPERIDDPVVMAQITEAVKKKNATLLSGFGWRRLAGWLLTTGHELMTSPTSRSGMSSDS